MGQEVRWGWGPRMALNKRYGIVGVGGVEWGGGKGEKS